jgi:hypothetical protein
MRGPDYFHETEASLKTAAGGPANNPANLAAVMRHQGLTPAP